MLWMYRHTKYVNKYQADIQSNFLDLPYVKLLKYILRRSALPNIFKSTHLPMLPSICKKRTGHDRSVERRDSQGTNPLERAKPRCSVVVLSWHCRSIRRGGTAALRPSQPSLSNQPTTLQSPTITHRNPQPSVILKSDHARQIDKSARQTGNCQRQEKAGGFVAGQGLEARSRSGATTQHSRP